MDGKKTIWVVIGGATILVGYRALRDLQDPIPQWAGIGAAGMILLFLAEPLPKFAASLAVLMGVALVFNLETAQRISGGGRRTGTIPNVVPSGPR